MLIYMGCLRVPFKQRQEGEPWVSWKIWGAPARQAIERASTLRR